MDKQTQLIEFISEARVKRKEYEMVLNRIGRIIGTDISGAELVLGLTSANTANANVSKVSTDTSQPIIDFLSKKKGEAVSLIDMYKALGDGCTYGAFTSRVAAVRDKGSITSLRRGFYSISANTLTRVTETKQKPKMSIDTLGEGAAKVHKFIDKNPETSAVIASKKLKMAKSTIHYHLKRLMEAGLIHSPSSGSYSTVK